MTEDKRPESTLCAAATNALGRRARRPGDPRAAGSTGLSQCSAQHNKISLMTLGRKGRKGEEKERGDRDFPGGAVVKKPPANAGDTGSSPGPGRSHMPRSNYARAPQLLSLPSRAREPQLLSL